MTPHPCSGCRKPVLAGYSLATGWGIVLDAAVIPTIIERDKVKRSGETVTVERRVAAEVGYGLAHDGAASTACAPGPDGYAGAGESHRPHACTGTRRVEVVAVQNGGQVSVHPCTVRAHAAAWELLGGQMVGPVGILQRLRGHLVVHVVRLDAHESREVAA